MLLCFSSPPRVQLLMSSVKVCHIILEAVQAIDRLGRYWKRLQFAHLRSGIGYLGGYFCLCVIFWLHSSTRDVQLRLPS